MDGLVEVVWWHEGRSPAYGDGVTFWALGEMVRGRAGLQESDDEATTRARIAAMLERHVADAQEREWIEPALLSLLGVDSGAASQAGGQQLFGAWRTFFERLAATGPVVMVFEDLHHADPGLLDFIDHLLEWSRALPILIVTLARPELLERRPDWGAGKRSFTSIYLEPLPVEAMRETARRAWCRACRTRPATPSSRGPTGCRSTRSKPSGCCWPRAGSLLEGGVYRAGRRLERAGRARDADRADLRPPRRARRGRPSAGRGRGGPGPELHAGRLAAVSGSRRSALEPRLRALVRRELLVQQVDPRSPERGQYAFVQALIREVAYNTLAKRDRKVRHLAAARYFEIARDRRAGRRAGRPLPRRPRLRRRRTRGRRPGGPGAGGAARSGRARGVTGLPRAGDRLPRARPGRQPEPRPTAPTSTNVRLRLRCAGLERDVAERHALAALEARRELGDRQDIALATAEYAAAMLGFAAPIAGQTARPAQSGLGRSFRISRRPTAGVRLMIMLARVDAPQDDPEVMRWIERLLPVAERLRDDRGRSPEGLIMRSSALFRLRRPTEGLIMLRGGHELAVANDLEQVHRRLANDPDVLRAVRRSARGPDAGA